MALLASSGYQPQRIYRLLALDVNGDFSSSSEHLFVLAYLQQRLSHSDVQKVPFSSCQI